MSLEAGARIGPYSITGVLGMGGMGGNLAPSALVLVPTGGGRPVELTDRTSLNQGPVWSPDGRLLYFVSNRQGPRDIYVVDIADDGRARGEPRRVTTGLGVQSMAFSATGERLTYVIYAARSNIWSLPIPTGGVVDTAGARVLTSGSQIVESTAVSTDGRWLLYDSNLHLNAEIFRMPVAGGPVERLTNDPADDFAPDLSPDGTELAYHSWRSGSRDIYVKKVDSGAPQAVTATPSQESYPVWSPDGRAIAYFDQLAEGGAPRGSFVVRRDPSGVWSAPVLVRAGATRTVWLPDGPFRWSTPPAGSLQRPDTPVHPFGFRRRGRSVLLHARRASGRHLGRGNHATLTASSCYCRVSNGNATGTSLS